MIRLMSYRTPYRISIVDPPGIAKRVERIHSRRAGLGNVILERTKNSDASLWADGGQTDIKEMRILVPSQ